jgi:hypothetical protein
MSEEANYKIIKDERKELESKISQLVIDYENKTGFRVSEIDLSSRRLAFMASELGDWLGINVIVKI